MMKMNIFMIIIGLMFTIKKNATVTMALMMFGRIPTVKTWEEKGSIHALGTYSSISVKVAFKPKGFVLTFQIKDDLRWEDKASYNTKTDQRDFPFYYSNAQEKIIEWGKSVFEENKLIAR